MGELLDSRKQMASEPPGSMLRLQATGFGQQASGRLTAASAPPPLSPASQHRRAYPHLPPPLPAEHPAPSPSGSYPPAS